MNFEDVETNKVSSNEAQRTGLCLDMCCERERITREYQRLYKSYEVDSDTRAVRCCFFLRLKIEFEKKIFLLFTAESIVNGH